MLYIICKCKPQLFYNGNLKMRVEVFYRSNRKLARNEIKLLYAYAYATHVTCANVRVASSCQSSFDTLPHSVKIQNLGAGLKAL
jgi:hypothetical protein